MKKFLVVMVMSVFVFTSNVLAQAKYNEKSYDVEIKAVSGELMLGARGIFEAMGYSVNWDANTKTTVFTDGENTINLVNSTGDLFLNGEKVIFNVKSGIYDDVTYIPAELLKKIGINIEWDYENNYPIIYSNDYTYNKAEIDYKETNGWNNAHNEYYINGKKLTGTQYIEGKLYDFGSDGTLTTGIFNDNGVIKGYDEYGNGYNGFLTYEGKKFYFEKGIAYTKPTAIKNKMYNFSSDGTLTTGWKEINGNKMYFNEFGYPVEGIVQIDTAKYYFIDGVMQTGSFVYNNNCYYAYDNGILAISTQIGEYYYDGNGIGKKYSQAYLNLQKKASTILSQIGKSPKAIYNYVVGHVRYKYMAQQDWTTMANTGFNTGRGACYNFAACVDILLKNAGYETRVVRGTGHFTSLHYWNQVKINGAWTNIDACNKYFEVSDAYLKGRKYTFNKYEYPQYY